MEGKTGKNLKIFRYSEFFLSSLFSSIQFCGIHRNSPRPHLCPSRRDKPITELPSISRLPKSITPPPVSDPESNENKLHLTIGILAGVLGVCLVVGVLGCWMFKKRGKQISACRRRGKFALM